MSELILSPSKINTFERCQLQYRYRYLEERIKLPGVALVIGTSTHKAIEANLLNKLETGELLPEDVVTDVARDCLEKEWHAGVQIDPDEPTTRGAAIDEAVELSRVHHQQVAPGVEPVHVERPFGVQVSSDIRLTGHIDVQEAAAIRDTKTINKTPGEIKGEHWVQSQLYAVGALVNDQKLPERIKIDYLVKLKKEKKAVTLEAEVNEQTAQRALDRLAITSRVIVRAIESGDFMPAPADSWACTEKWCGYFNECPFGALKKVQG